MFAALAVLFFVHNTVLKLFEFFTLLMLCLEQMQEVLICQLKNLTNALLFMGTARMACFNKQDTKKARMRRLKQDTSRKIREL
jgi:hypothetical protein